MMRNGLVAFDSSSNWAKLSLGKKEQSIEKMTEIRNDMILAIYSMKIYLGNNKIYILLLCH